MSGVESLPELHEWKGGDAPSGEPWGSKPEDYADVKPIEPDEPCIVCNELTDRRVTETFDNPRVPNITVPYCPECDE